MYQYTIVCTRSILGSDIPVRGLDQLLKLPTMMAGLCHISAPQQPGLYQCTFLSTLSRLLFVWAVSILIAINLDKKYLACVQD
jgi:hypothetical protein